MKTRKRILLVAMPDSVHTARWVNQVIDQGWELFIFPSKIVERAHPDIENIVILWSCFERFQAFLKSFGFQFAARLISLINIYLDKRYPAYRLSRLKKAVKRLKPDLIHSMEMQSAGYLTLEAKKSFHERFPAWLMTIWGSDIFLFGRLESHRVKIQNVLSECNYFSCECRRDSLLAAKLGFEGHLFPELPVSGGFNLTALKTTRSKETSSRKLIMLKGYQSWAGRALCGLRALERCVELLDEYTIVIFSAYPDVVMAAELFTEKTGIKTKILPHDMSHQVILELHAQARISIGLSISDGISVSLQEAMVMGSFPIQSCTACADEWIEHGVSGMIVPPEDPELIEMAIRTALLDDKLVNQAAEINWHVALQRLDVNLLKRNAIDLYNSILRKEC